MRHEILRLEHVTYKQGDETLLQDLDLNIFEGEVMGVLPIDAYGLQALIRLLSEHPPIYHGYIYYCEKLVDSWLDGSHNVKRIAWIGEKSTLVDGQSILTNVMVLRKGFHKELISNRLLKQQLLYFLEELGLALEPMTLVEKLTPFERVAVEILRAVVAGCRLIVLQEVSTIISDREMAQLFEIIHRYASKGYSFLYISPHLEEHLQICDRIAMMTGRRIIKILQGKEMSARTVEHYSKEYAMRVQERIINRTSGGTDRFCCTWKQKTAGTQQVELSVAGGECLAIQCLDGTVFQELVSQVRNQEVSVGGASKKHGKCAVILPQSWESMVFPELSAYDNLCIGMDQRVPAVWSSRHIARSICSTMEEQMGQGFMQMHICEMSAHQKSELVYSRILLQKPHVVFCIQPFKGADLAHRLLLWKLQKRLLDRGIAIVILAVNMSDTLAIADRVVRIDKDMRMESYERSEFLQLPETVPWYSFYQGMDENK